MTGLCGVLQRGPDRSQSGRFEQNRATTGRPWIGGTGRYQASTTFQSPGKAGGGSWMGQPNRRLTRNRLVRRLPPAAGEAPRLDRNPIRVRMSSNRARSAHLPSAAGRVASMASDCRPSIPASSRPPANDLRAMRPEPQRAGPQPNRPERPRQTNPRGPATKRTRVTKADHLSGLQPNEPERREGPASPSGPQPNEPERQRQTDGVTSHQTNPSGNCDQMSPKTGRTRSSAIAASR
jgi:hypothetical protein